MRTGAENGLLSLRLSVSQGVSLEEGNSMRGLPLLEKVTLCVGFLY